MSKKGFTLIELLIVIAVIGVLAAALLIGINPIEQINKAKDGGMISKCKEAIGAWERVVVSGQTPANCGALETVFTELKTGACTGITALNATTCEFNPVSNTYRQKCGFGSCTVPTEVTQ